MSLSESGPARTEAPGSSPPIRIRKAKYVSTACNACRTARTKCDGESPCQRCVAKGVQCESDESNDGRRNRKRVWDELQTTADAFQSLFASLRSSDTASSQELFDLIRNGSSVDIIMERTRAMQSAGPTRTKTRTSTRGDVLRIATLIDDPPIRVPARPWTTLTDDDLAVSHLISVYFTWQNPGYPSVDQDIFVRHMNAGLPTSQFCSPVLVHAMLLAACVYTDHPLVFAKPNDPSTRGLHFLEELKTLWASQQGKVSLVNLQALPPYIAAVAALGQDRIGLDLTNQCAHASSEITREIKKGRKRGQEIYSTPDFQKSYSLALWAAFIVRTEVSIAWLKPIDLWKPKRDHPYTTEELQRTTQWRPYPKQGPEIQMSPSILTQERMKLYAVASDLLPLVLSGLPGESPAPGFTFIGDDLKLSRLNHISDQLEKWQQNLVPEAQLEVQGEFSPNGPLFDLHMAYNAYRLSTLSLILRVTDITDEAKEAASNRVMSVCSRMADVILQFQKTSGLEYFGLLLPHAASLSAYNLLPFLDRPRAADIFHVAIVALLAVSRRWRIAHGVVRMIWIEVRQQNLVPLLSESTMSLLKLGAVDSWRPEDHRLLEECAYPNQAVLKEKGALLAEMGDLLEEYARLNVDDDSELPPVGNADIPQGTK